GPAHGGDGLSCRADGSPDDAADPDVLAGSQHPAGDCAANGNVARGSRHVAVHVAGDQHRLSGCVQVVTQRVADGDGLALLDHERHRGQRGPQDEKSRNSSADAPTGQVATSSVSCHREARSAVAISFPRLPNGVPFRISRFGDNSLLVQGTEQSYSWIETLPRALLLSPSGIEQDERSRGTASQPASRSYVLSASPLG